MVVKNKTLVKTNRLLMLSVASAIVAASCGTADAPGAGATGSPSTTVAPPTSIVAPPTAPPPTSTAPLAAADTTDLTAACGSVEFDAASVDVNQFEPFTDEIGPLIGEPAREEYEVSLDWWASFAWSVVESTNTTLLLFGQEQEPTDERTRFATAMFEFGDQGWQATGWGGCRIEMGLDGYGIATIALDPENPPSANTTTLLLLATERECASGLTPIGREVLPLVVETDTAVNITTLVESSTGIQNCPSNPAFPISIQLSTPLGNRVIRDTALYPAEERLWPLLERAPYLALRTAGDPPTQGTANVVTWTGEHSGALLFGPDGWSTDPTWFQSFEQQPPTIITGFVTPCDETTGCPEELEQEQFETIPRVGDECTLTYTPTPGQDATVTIQFLGSTCTIELVSEPVS